MEALRHCDLHFGICRYRKSLGVISSAQVRAHRSCWTEGRSQNSEIDHIVRSRRTYLGACVQYKSDIDGKVIFRLENSMGCSEPWTRPRKLQ
jgi:hypothetical protein